MPKKEEYNSKNSPVYHTDPDCQVGNNIEDKNRQSGKGGKRPCQKCNPPKKQKK